MSQRTLFTLRARVLAIAGAIVLAGCAADAPEERLLAAGERLNDASDELARVNGLIDEHESALAELRSDRLRLRNRLVTLDRRLEARATDVALFRAVQSALLNDDSLRNSAIAVTVEDGAVTLSGTVRETAERLRAVNVARGIAGVVKVTDRVSVDGPSDGGSVQDHS